VERKYKSGSAERERERERARVWSVARGGKSVRRGDQWMDWRERIYGKRGVTGPQRESVFFRTLFVAPGALSQLTLELSINSGSEL
jgi:hypothetical protein